MTIFMAQFFLFLSSWKKVLGENTWYQNSLALKLIQGDPNQNLLIQMAITLKVCISDYMLESKNVFRIPKVIFTYELFVYDFQK